MATHALAILQCFLTVITCVAGSTIELLNGPCLKDYDVKGFPKSVDISTIRSTCNYKNDTGWAFIIQWITPEGILKYPATYYVVSLISDCTGLPQCYRHNDTMSPSFVFDSNKSMNSGCDYEVAIIPKPSPITFSIPLTYIGKCPRPTTKAPRKTTTEPPRKSANVKLGLIVGGIMGSYILFGGILFFTWFRYKRKERGQKHNPGGVLKERNNIQVYVSYAQFNKKEEDRILQLAVCLNECSIHVCMDLLKQVEIHEMGGLPFWISEKMNTCDKILLVLTPAYLKALQTIRNTKDELDDGVCKIHAEFSFIRTMLYGTAQRAPKLVVLLDSVKREEIPDILQGRAQCYLTKKFSPDDKCIHKLALILHDTEPLQMENPTEDPKS